MINICVYIESRTDIKHHGRWYDDDTEYNETRSHSLYSSEPIILKGMSGYVKAVKIWSIINQDNTIIPEDKQQLHVNFEGCGSAYYSYYGFSLELSKQICNTLNDSLEEPIYCVNESKSVCKEEISLYSLFPNDFEPMREMDIVYSEIETKNINKYKNTFVEIDQLKKSIEENKAQIENLQKQIKESESEIRKIEMHKPSLLLKVQYIEFIKISNYIYKCIENRTINMSEKIPELFGYTLIVKNGLIPIKQSTGKDYTIKNLSISDIYPLDIALMTLNHNLLKLLINKRICQTSDVWVLDESFILDASETPYSEYSWDSGTNGAKAFFEGYYDMLWDFSSNKHSLLKYILLYMCESDMNLYFEYINKLQANEDDLYSSNCLGDIFQAELLATLRTNNVENLIRLCQINKEHTTKTTKNVFYEYQSKLYYSYLSKEMKMAICDNLNLIL